MRRLISSLQFRLTAGFAILLALALASVSFYSALTTQHQTKVFAAQVEAARTERAEILVENAYQANEDWAQVQLAASQIGGLYDWRVVVVTTDGYVVADSHQIVQTVVRAPDYLDDSWFGGNRQIVRRPLVFGNQVVGEIVMDNRSSTRRPALSMSEFGSELFEAFGIPVGGGNRPTPVPGIDNFPSSTSNNRIPAETLAGSEQAATEAALDALDELLVEPPLTDLEKSFRRSLIYAGVGAMAAGLIFVTVFTRQALAPVRGLTSGARKLGAGDLTFRVPENRDDEVGQLARTFNEMANDLESAEIQRRRMTADIAHELRTPLTNIQGYLEAILDGLVEPDTKTISDLHEQTVHLSRLVDDLRLLSVAEAGALRLEVSPDSLESVIRDSAKTFEPRAIELGIELCVSAEKQLPPVDLDRTRMRQVAVNLIENALHHTPPGGRVSIDLANDASGGVRMTISDTGRGIKPEELPRIFDQFYRVDASRSRATGGAGLGLTIVKRLVEAHNGAISVASTPGKGTSFVITLPRSASPAAA